MVSFRKEHVADGAIPELSIRNASVRAAESGGDFCIDAVLSTESPVAMFDRVEWEYMDEVLLASGRTQLDHVVLLNSHMRWTVDDVIGHIEDIRTDGNGNTVVKCCFDSEDENALRIFRKYKNKHARAFSVGYTVLKFTDIAAGQSGIVDGKEYKAGPSRKLRIVTKWRVDEGSVVAIGADKKALARTLESGVSSRSGLSFQIEEGDEVIIDQYKDRKPTKRQAEAEVPSKPDVPVGSTDTKSERSLGESIASATELKPFVAAASPSIVINIGGEARTVAVDDGNKKTSSDPTVGSGGAEAPVSVEVPADSGGDEKRSDAVGGSNPAEPVGITEEEVNKRIAAAQAEGAKREAERRTAIRKAAEGLDIAQDVIDSCVDDPACDESVARAKFLESLRSKRSAPVTTDAPNIQLSGRKKEGMTPAQIATALAIKIGGERAGKAVRCMNFRDGLMTMRPMDATMTEESRKAFDRDMDVAIDGSRMAVLPLMRQHLRASGVGYDIDDEADVIMARSMSTPTISSIFTQTMGAVLLANMFEIGPDSTRQWTKDRYVPNFKAQELHRFEGSGLSRRTRGKDADQASFADSYETIRVYEYAKQFRVDRQDLIDDDLNAFATWASQWAQDVYNLRPALVYGYLASNPVLVSDGVALFHANHGNLKTSHAISNVNVANAMTYLASMRGIGGQLLNLNEGVIVCAYSESFDVDQLINSSEVRNMTGSVDRGTANPLKGRQRLSAYDVRFDTPFTYPFDQSTVAAAPTVWYYAQKGGQYGVNVAYRTGTNGLPTFRTRNLGGGTWGEEMDMNLDIGVGVEGYQGILKLS